MFNKNQLASLNQELDSSRIKTREKGNINLSYIEGFDVIDTANKVFGFGNWSYLISKLEQVSQEQNHNQNYVVCYKAVVKLIVKDENHTKSISRQDVGFGSGVAKALNDAYENAGKEAVTDGLKRAMRSFGNQFGNSLYDKSRNQQNQDSSYQNQQRQSYQNENVNSRATNSNFRSVGNQQQARQNQTQNQTMQQQVQNSNTRTTNQNLNNQQQQHSFQNNQSFDQYEYQNLYNLGLDVIEQNSFLIVIGDNQYAYKDSIKACGFRFDSKSKTWYKQLEQRAS